VGLKVLGGEVDTRASLGEKNFNFHGFL